MHATGNPNCPYVLAVAMPVAPDGCAPIGRPQADVEERPVIHTLEDAEHKEERGKEDDAKDGDESEGHGSSTNRL